MVKKKSYINQSYCNMLTVLREENGDVARNSEEIKTKYNKSISFNDFSINN